MFPLQSDKNAARIILNNIINISKCIKIDCNHKQSTSASIIEMFYTIELKKKKMCMRLYLIEYIAS